MQENFDRQESMHGTVDVNEARRNEMRRDDIQKDKTIPLRYDEKEKAEMKKKKKDVSKLFLRHLPEIDWTTDFELAQ